MADSDSISIQYQKVGHTVGGTTFLSCIVKQGRHNAYMLCDWKHLEFIRLQIYQDTFTT